MLVNADEISLIGERLIAPKGIKHVGTTAQVDNEKWGAVVIIGCEYRTSSILPPMVIFTGVYSAKLMFNWANIDQGKLVNHDYQCYCSKPYHLFYITN